MLLLLLNIPNTPIITIVPGRELLRMESNVSIEVTKESKFTKKIRILSFFEQVT